ncbi:hypothetical protein Tco_1525017 [Tanacetum coccineum]
MSAAAISKLVADEVAKALEADRAARTNLNVAGGSSRNGGQGGALPIRECSFGGFMKCGPTQFYGNEGHIASNRRVKAVATGANVQYILTFSGCGEKGHTKNHCLKRNDPQGGNE